MLLSVFMTITSVGWLQAQDGGPTITTDLTVAQKDRAIVFGITTTKGNAEDVKVRASLTADGNAFEGWESFYYEPNGNNPGWVKWNPENDGFGPAEGFPLMDATSYIKVVPRTAGTFTYTLNVTKVGVGDTLITQPCTLVVKDEPVSPIASINGTDYASLYTAVHFAGENNTISLTAGDFLLTRGTESIASGNNESGWYLPIDKEGIKIVGATDGNNVPTSHIYTKVDASNGVWSSQN